MYYVSWSAYTLFQTGVRTNMLQIRPNILSNSSANLADKCIFKICMPKDVSSSKLSFLRRELENKIVQVHRVTEKFTHLW